MKERHQLLKVGGILLFFLGIATLIYGIITAIQMNNLMTAAGATAGLVGEAFGEEGSLVAGTAVGSAIGSVLGGTVMIVTIIAAALYIITGLLGFKGNSLTACKVFGIIVLILAVIGFIGGIGSIAIAPITFILNLLDLVLALVYVIGAFKSVKA